MSHTPEPMPRRSFLQALFVGAKGTDTGEVAFHPLLARTAVLLVALTAVVSAAQRVLAGTWQVHALLPVGLAGFIVVRIALNPAVRHRWQALAAFAAVVLVLGRRVDTAGAPLTLNALAAAFIAVAVFAAVTHLPARMFTRGAGKPT